MRLVFGLVLILGLGLAGFAVYMAKSYIQSYQTQLALERSQRAPQIETIEVAVANKPLKYGDRIPLDAVRMVKFPKNALPEGAFTTAEALFPNGKDELRAVRRAMEKNEAILEAKVTKPGADAGISDQLGPGMRAFAIKVDVASGVSGFLRPGDHVDVYWTGRVRGNGVRTEGDSFGEVTKLIQTGVRLIAVDQMSDENTTKAIIARTVTVSAKPQDVAALAQAQATGRLALSLVGVRDETVAEVIEVDQRRLLGLSEVEEAPEPERAEVCTIRTRRGSEVIVSQIPCTN
ncbi:MAG TPA: Flp pilus assembly protein CpaB [Roseovarius sp.]|uniref:Flp pilus assembly protein CpaB n=1 Tax=Marivita sp. TaxID=2003365 RepID=UPI0025BA94AD|nr:Flp pilus assembly protein CpaB [Marivita sp.]HKK85085.1 Flp pilus assembly protein CpaB [Roseovarius sp.]HKL45361.1 Flp pilus assembly protein CpaB [Roseovarius sp.]